MIIGVVCWSDWTNVCRHEACWPLSLRCNSIKARGLQPSAFHRACQASPVLRADSLDDHAAYVAVLRRMSTASAWKLTRVLAVLRCISLPTGNAGRCHPPLYAPLCLTACPSTSSLSLTPFRPVPHIPNPLLSRPCHNHSSPVTTPPAWTLPLPLPVPPHPFTSHTLTATRTPV